MPCMDTTSLPAERVPADALQTVPGWSDSIDRIAGLLEDVAGMDPADAVGPLVEVADILERLLDGGADD